MLNFKYFVYIISGICILVVLFAIVCNKRSPFYSSVSKLKDKMNRKISSADLDATTRYELHTRLEGMPKHNKVCHGDFNPTNIIITPEGKAYIVDWAHATQGNASADIARSCAIVVFSITSGS